MTKYCSCIPIEVMIATNYESIKEAEPGELCHMWLDAHEDDESTKKALKFQGKFSPVVVIKDNAAAVAAGQEEELYTERLLAELCVTVSSPSYSWIDAEVLELCYRRLDGPPPPCNHRKQAVEATRAKKAKVLS